MKIRNGFVSNSSSSSFIVIDRGKYTPISIPNELFYEKEDWGHIKKKISIPNKKGFYDFGWDTDRYYDFTAKLNYVAIQALSINDSEEKYKAKEIIEKAIAKETGDDYTIEWDYNSIEWDSPDHFAYIDHESCAFEYNHLNQCWNCREAFKSVETMHAFLFNSESYVQGGNDNTGWEEGDDYFESLVKMYGKVYINHYYGEYYKGPYPFHEGTCKINSDKEILFNNIWHIKNGISLNTIDDIHNYFGLNKEDPFPCSYYFCSSPCDKKDCPFKKWHFIKDDKDIATDPALEEYMNWNEEFK